MSAEILQQIYDVLDRHFGDLHWWPGETPFEVAIGAILTQNTNWNNVEKAIRALRSENVLNPHRIVGISDSHLARLIRSVGFYNVKMKRLRAFCAWLNTEYSGNMKKMFREEMWSLREKLLSVHGIGEETADSILLYGGGKPIFVVDAYTRRIMARHGLMEEHADYRAFQMLFMNALPHEASLFNQYHALLVMTGKSYCKKEPKCTHCPLSRHIET